MVGKEYSLQAQTSINNEDGGIYIPIQILREIFKIIDILYYGDFNTF